MAVMWVDSWALGWAQESAAESGSMSDVALARKTEVWRAPAMAVMWVHSWALELAQESAAESGSMSDEAIQLERPLERASVEVSAAPSAATSEGCSEEPMDWRWARRSAAAKAET